MKELAWLGSSRKDLMKFPKEVIQEVGYALHIAQQGEHYDKVKALKGFGSGVYEIVLDHDTNAYRAVYVVNIGDALYVVHCFQKKSKRGIKTPKEAIDVIEQRLKLLRAKINER